MKGKVKGKTKIIQKGDKFFVTIAKNATIVVQDEALANFIYESSKH